MNHSGYEQHLCINGHLFCVAAHMSHDENLCPACTSPSVWYNEVNDLDDYGYIEMDAFMVLPELQEVCSLGHSHVVMQAVYRIPTDDEKNTCRTYEDESGEKVYIDG